VQEATGQTVEVAYVDQGYTGPAARDAAAQHGIDLVVVKLAEANAASSSLPRRWVVERSFAWATRFRRLAKDYERLPENGRSALSSPSRCLMLKRLLLVATQSPYSSNPVNRLNRPVETTIGAIHDHPCT
jgi:transposase